MKQLRQYIRQCIQDLENIDCERDGVCMQVAELVSELSGCKIKISHENPDKRNYRVSADKIKRSGFNPTHTIKQSFNEFENKVKSGEIKNYKEAIYNNYKQLFESDEARKKAFI